MKDCTSIVQKIICPWPDRPMPLLPPNLPKFKAVVSRYFSSNSPLHPALNKEEIETLKISIDFDDSSSSVLIAVKASDLHRIEQKQLLNYMGQWLLAQAMNVVTGKPISEDPHFAILSDADWGVLTGLLEQPSPRKNSVSAAVLRTEKNFTLQ